MPQAAIKAATPTNTPSSEKPLFSFCARMVCSAIRTASKNGTLGGPGVIRGDHAVAQCDHAFGVSGDVLLVRHHHHCLSLAIEFREHAHDFRAGGGVEVSR